MKREKFRALARFYKTFEILNCAKAIKDFLIYLLMLANSYDYLLVAPLYKLYAITKNLI